MGHRPRHAAPRRRRPLARRLSRLAGTALATSVAVLGVVGTAYGVWTSGGVGTSTLAAASAQPLTTSPVTLPTTLLYPGATADAALTVNNPNPFPVTVTAISAGTITSDKGAACDASTGVSFATQSGSWSVAAGGSRTLSLPGAVTMSNASADACQGAVFTVPVTLTAASG